LPESKATEDREGEGLDESSALFCFLEYWVLGIVFQNENK